MELINYCWEIWYDDVFLGYEYANDADNAVVKSVGIGGVASQYGVKIGDLIAKMS